MPTCWIIAGPNGAGKTTFALEYLPQVAGCTHFINADLIAAREDFAFETTLAGRTYLRLVDRLHTDGWPVQLIYLALPSVEMSKLRVAERVAHGGHSIPLEDIERRFPRSLNHLLNDFSHRADSCTCFMNDGESPVLVFEQRGSEREIVLDDYYQLLLEEAKQ